MNTLEIRSPNNVAIEYTLAPLIERVFAFLLDLALVGIVMILVASTFGQAMIRVLGDDQFLLLFLFGFLPLLTLFTYFACAEFYLEGQTLGKKLLHLRTIRIDGRSPSFETYAVRSIMLMIDFVMSAGTLGILSAASSPNTQRTGDRIAQTVVVKANPRSLFELNHILAIKTVDDHAVKFPESLRLNINQALALKELISRHDTDPTEAIRAMVSPTALKVAAIINIAELPRNRLEFLRQVLRDYIVLTR